VAGVLSYMGGGVHSGNERGGEKKGGYSQKIGKKKITSHRLKAYKQSRVGMPD